MCSILSLVIVFLQAQHSVCLPDSNGKETQPLRFIALGDWGGLPFGIFNYSTAVERGVADGMGDLAAQFPQDFVIGLGDNFYFTGVDDVNDIRFYETFESIFSASSLIDVPWYLCAGNHDHYGNVSGQIAYTEKSARWNFPSYYYTRTWPIPGTSRTLELVLIDTVILCGGIESDESQEQPKLSGRKAKAMAEAQWTWLEETLRISTADYLLVGGHYPVLSAGAHGSTKCLVKRLKPLLEKYRVTAYICGHDHNNQHIDDDTGVQYLITGCATFAQDWPWHQDEIGESLKFFWAEREMLGGYISFVASQTELSAVFMAGTGEELHSVAMAPRTDIKN